MHTGERKTYSIEEAARILGIGRNAAYEEVMPPAVPLPSRQKHAPFAFFPVHLLAPSLSYS